METVDLPIHMQPLRLTYLVDWRPAEKVEPNLELLSKMQKGRSRQSTTSRKRQAFISGMNIYRASGDELRNKRTYIEEWHIRISDNE